MTLVILPGMDGTGLFLDPFISSLGTGFDVKVVQYPTSPPLGYTELEDFAGAALPREGPFFILGESFSGPLAVALAAKDSSRLNGLILCASFVRNPRPGVAWLKPFIGIVPIGGAPIAALSYLLIGRCSASPLRAALSAALEKISPATLRTRLRAVLAVDVSAKLAHLDVPILYLRASRDRVVPCTASALITQANPAARIIPIEAHHFLLQTAPAEAARAVSDFIRKTWLRRSSS